MASDSLKRYYKAAKNTVLQIPELEKKVKEATSNEKWGPSGTQMRELAQATFSYHDLPVIMAVIWKRLNDPGKYWRHVYKSLLLIDYLIRNGSDQVIRECRANVIQIQTLMEFQHIDEQDKDVGISVRERAKAIVDLLHDEKRIKDERDKAKSNAKKYLVGMGSDQPSWGYSDDRSYSSDDRPPYGSERRESAYESDDDEEIEREREREKREREKEREKQPTSRPRAPSAETKPQAQNLFEFEDTPQPKPQNNDPFGGFTGSSQPAVQKPFDPFQTQQPHTANNDFAFDPRGFGTQPAPQTFPQTFTSPQTFSPQPIQPQTTFFGATPTPTDASWANFEGSSNAQQQQQQDTQAEPAQNDPWAKKHLFDLDLTAKKSSTTQSSGQNKTPMGAIGTPIGAMGGSKPMGNPPPMGNPTPMGGFGGSLQPTPVTAQPMGGFMGAQPVRGVPVQPMGGFVGAQPQPMGGFVGAQPQPMGGFVGAQPMGAQPMGGFVGAQPMGGFGVAPGPTLGGQPIGAVPPMGRGFTQPQPARGGNTQSWI